MLENSLKKHVHNVAEIKYGFVKLFVILLFTRPAEQFFFQLQMWHIRIKREKLILHHACSSTLDLKNFENCLWIILFMQVTETQ